MRKMRSQHTNIFTRILNGEAVPFNDEAYHEIIDACNETRKLLVRLNSESDSSEIRKLLSKITGSEIHESTSVFPPFQINYGKNISAVLPLKTT
jgi:hypothetical protein